MNNKDILNEFLHWHRAMLHTEKTIQNYKDVLTLYFDFCDINNIFPHSNLSVTQWTVDLRSRGLKRSSICSYLRHLKSYIHWLGENGYIEDMELYRKIKIPKDKKKNIKIYTDEEIKQIYNVVSTSSNWITYRNKFIISLMYDSGLRRNECTELLRKDLLEDNLLVVHGKGGKDRIVPLGELTLYYYELYNIFCPFTLPKNNNLLFCRSGKPLTSNAIKQFFSSISAKLPFEFSPHRLRHNFATNYLIDCYNKKGFLDAYSLQVLMGHEDISTTNRYIHLASQYIATRYRVSHLDIIYEKVSTK